MLFLVFAVINYIPQLNMSSFSITISNEHVVVQLLHLKLVGILLANLILDKIVYMFNCENILPRFSKEILRSSSTIRGESVEMLNISKIWEKQNTHKIPFKNKIFTLVQLCKHDFSVQPPWYR